MPSKLWRRVGLAVLLSQALAAAPWAASVTWSTPGTGFWDDAANWPAGALPGGSDVVTIDLGAATAVLRQLPGAPASPLTRYTVASLLAKSPFEHAGGSLLVKGNATFQQTFTWSGGVLHLDPSVPTGTWTFERGLHFTAPGVVGMNAGAVELRGTSVLDGARGILFGAVPVHIAAGALLEIRSGQQLVTAGDFVNDGSIDRTAGTDSFEISLRGGGNQGTVRNRTGVLGFRSSAFDPITHTGSFAVDAGAVLRFTGDQRFQGALSGAGTVAFTNGNVYTVDASRFALTGTLRLEGGARGIWVGNGTVGQLHLAGGNFNPQGQVDILQRAQVDIVSTLNGAAGSRTRFIDGLDLQSSLVIGAGAVELGGATVMAGGAVMSLREGASLTVLPGALLRATNDATPTGAGGILGDGRFINRGVVQRDTGTGDFQFLVAEFQNAGRLALQSGRASAGPDFQQTPDGTLAITLGAVTGPFAVAGAARLAGVLEIGFADGFLPMLGQSFELMTYGTHQGVFGLSLVGEAARTGYAYALTYGDQALSLQVTGLAPPVPEPATWAMAAAGLALLLVRRRRGR